MATIWDSGQKSANITLSGGSLVATVSNTSASGVRATRVATGPTYMEMTATLIAVTSFCVGFCDYSFSVSATTLGADTHGIGYKQDGTVKINGSTLATIATYTTADRVGIAYHPQFQLFWARVNNGNWNNNGANNPANATIADTQGGLSTTTLASSALFPAFTTIGTANAAVTAKFSTAFTDTAPTGFVSVDNVGATAFSPELPSGTPGFVGASRKDPVTDVNQFAFGFAGSAYGNYSGTKTVSGNVKEFGVNATGKKVLLIDRNGQIIGVATTDGSGNYTIKGRGRNSTVAIALDDPNFNALVYDVVVPV